MRILVLNGGSSSFKCWLGEVSPSGMNRIWESHFDLKSDSSIPELLTPVLKSVPAPVDAVGHRIVHGGPKYRQTTELNPEVRAAIAQQVEIAPAHNRLELAAIETVDRTLGSGIRQFAIFDTAFHATLEPAAYIYPGPYDWVEQGIRRYGFHGISHQYAARRAAEMLGRENLRLITCHLGNGASLCAVHGGISVDTTMGFTPLEGLMMGTRSGSIDPGIILYLLRRGHTAEQIDRTLNRESGLSGISGVSGDMREILAAIENGNQRAKLAFDIYSHRVCQGVGAMLGVLGGADALVFTGGVGENCTQLRDVVARQFSFLNAPSLVVHAEEETEIARDCSRLLIPS